MSAKAIYLLALATTLLPIFFVHYLPLVDLPGHVGRIPILEHYDRSPALQARYEIDPRPLPNIALDGLLLLFSRVMPVAEAARAFVLLAMILFAAGVASLSYSLYGRLVPIAALALFVQYNSTFFYGFVAYHLGMGMFVLTFALWYRWREKWSLPQLLVLLVLGTFTYFAHLAGYMFLGIAVGLTLAIDWFRSRKLPLRPLLGALALSVPVFLYLSLGQRRGSVQVIEWGSLMSKVRHSAILLLGYNHLLDLVLGVIIVGALLVALVRCKPVLHPVAALLGGAFALGFCILPDVLLTGTDADTRMIPPAGLLLLLSLQFTARPRLQRVAFALAGVALVVRVGHVAWTWQQQNRQLLEPAVAIFENIPRNAAVYPIWEPNPNSEEAKFEMPMFHFISWASVTRNAIVPTTFTAVGQQPVVNRPEFQYRPVSFENRAPEGGWEQVFRNYDFIWFYGTDPKIRNILEARCSTIFQNGKRHLYRVLK